MRAPSSQSIFFNFHAVFGKMYARQQVSVPPPGLALPGVNPGSITA